MNSILTGVLLLFFSSDMSFTEITEVYLFFVSLNFLCYLTVTSATHHFADVARKVSNLFNFKDIYDIR